MAIGIVQPLLQGSSGLNLGGVRSRIAQAEAGTPEGTPVQLQLSFANPSIFGQVVPLHQYAAGAINAAVSAGQIVSGSETIQPWPGNQQVATYDDAKSATTIQWLHGQVFSPQVIAILIGLAVVGGILLYLYVHHWSFGAFVQAAAQTPIAGVPLEDWLIAGLIVVFGIPLARHL